MLLSSISRSLDRAVAALFLVIFGIVLSSQDKLPDALQVWKSNGVAVFVWFSSCTLWSLCAAPRPKRDCVATISDSLMRKETRN
jgi:hypothetical protein